MPGVLPRLDEDEAPGEARAARSGGDPVEWLIDYLADAGAGDPCITEKCAAARRAYVKLVCEHEQLTLTARAVIRITTDALPKLPQN